MTGMISNTLLQCYQHLHTSMLGHKGLFHIVFYSVRIYNNFNCDKNMEILPWLEIYHTIQPASNFHP